MLTNIANFVDFLKHKTLHIINEEPIYIHVYGARITNRGGNIKFSHYFIVLILYAHM